MLSHDNITWTAQQTKRVLPDSGLKEERVISYLPLSHIAAQVEFVEISVD